MVSFTSFRYFSVPFTEDLHHLIMRSRFRSYFYRSPEAYLFSAHTLKTLQRSWREGKLAKRVSGHTEMSVSTEELFSLNERVKVGTRAQLEDAPSSRALIEIALFLKTHPTFLLEYVGRKISNGSSIEGHIKNEAPRPPYEITGGEQSLLLDIAGRTRRYVWKIHHKEFSEGIETDFSKQFPHLKEWFSDPDAQVVLSLGGGGMRAWSMLSVLGILEGMGVRKHISEVWGCSGGAIVGSLYSAGVTQQTITECGYDFYHGRYPDYALKGMNLGLIWRIIKVKIKDRNKTGSGIIDTEKTFQKAWDKALESRDLTKNEIPFFAISTRAVDKKVVVLAEPKYFSPMYKDFMMPATVVQSFCASSAIPLLFSPTELMDQEGCQHSLVDGMFSEEIPLFHPYLKWQLDRRQKPFETKPKLKIFYVDLRCRVSEMSLIRNIEKLSFGDKLTLMPRLFDLLMDNRNKISTSLLQCSPDVEVKGVSLELGRLAAIDTDLIPWIMEKSRDHFLNEFSELEKHFKSESKQVVTEFVIPKAA